MTWGVSCLLSLFFVLMEGVHLELPITVRYGTFRTRFAVHGAERGGGGGSLSLLVARGVSGVAHIPVAGHRDCYRLVFPWFDWTS